MEASVNQNMEHGHKLPAFNGARPPALALHRPASSIFGSCSRCLDERYSRWTFVPTQHCMDRTRPEFAVT